MSYQPLAVKYRPQSFGQLVGQEAASLALSNAVRLGRVPNAVILSGIRGTGKTTLARIYAKALNCSNPIDGSPCLQCDNCKAISAGIHEDVVEIDGASNTGVDDIRALKETVVYVPQRGKYKIYIIDEVHMLSTSAFNALLKTLEEPPSNVVFIFATTEFQKIPQTIVSRCQTFFLEKISYQDIYSRLVWILNEESISFDEKALRIIVKEAGGSMRDALTLLDKTIVLGGGKVDLGSISKISASGSSLCLDLVEHLQKKDKQAVFSTMRSLEDSGVDLGKVVDELIQITRHCFILKDLGGSEQDIKALGLDDIEYGRLSDIAKYAHPLELNTLFRLLVKCRSDLTRTDLDRYIVENYLLEWCIIPYRNPLLSFGGSTDKNINKNENSGSLGGSTKESLDTPNSSGSLSFTPSTGKKLSALDFSMPSGSDTRSEPIEAPMNQLEVSLQSNPTTEISSSPKANQPTHSILSKLKDLDSYESKEEKTPILDTNLLSSSSIEENGPRFPSSWEELVETWKGKKPFQARILEETICTSYSQESICLLINKSSLAARQLLQEQQKRSIEESFKTLFGFNGRLQVFTDKEDSSSGNSQDILDKNSTLIDNVEGAALAEHLSILDKKKIARQQREKFLNEQLAGNCITEIINSTFKNNKITSISVDE